MAAIAASSPGARSTMRGLRAPEAAARRSSSTASQASVLAARGLVREQDHLAVGTHTNNDERRNGGSVAVEPHPRHRAVLGSAARSACGRDHTFYACQSSSLALLLAHPHSSAEQPALCAAHPALSSQRADAVDKSRRRQAGRADRPATPGSSFQSSHPRHGPPVLVALMARAFLTAGSLAVYATGAAKCRIELDADQFFDERTRPRVAVSTRSIVDFGLRGRQVGRHGGLIYRIVWRVIAGDLVSPGAIVPRRDVGRADRSPTEASMFRETRPCGTLRTRSTSSAAGPRNRGSHTRVLPFAAAVTRGQSAVTR